MDEFKTYKDQSRRNWYNAHNQTQVPLDDIQTGCLQRIADATEAISKNYIRLQADAEDYKRLYNEELAEKERLKCKIAALKGVITKLKKKIA